MKKMYFTMMLVGVMSSATFAQGDVIENPSSTPTVTTTTYTPDNTPFGTASRTRCNRCYKYHSPVCTPPPTPTPVPFDGGLSVLLVAGAAYGVKRMRGKKQPQDKI